MAGPRSHHRERGDDEHGAQGDLEDEQEDEDEDAEGGKNGVHDGYRERARVSLNDMKRMTPAGIMGVASRNARSDIRG